MLSLKVFHSVCGFDSLHRTLLSPVRLLAGAV